MEKDSTQEKHENKKHSESTKETVSKYVEKAPLPKQSSRRKKSKGTNRTKSKKTEKSKIANTNPQHKDTDIARNETDKQIGYREDRQLQQTTAFLELCATKASLKEARAGQEHIIIPLPEGLLPKMIIRSIRLQKHVFTALKEEMIALDESRSKQLEIKLDEVSKQNYEKLVEELNLCIEEFTARS